MFKYFYIFLAGVLTFGTVSGQVLTSDPPFPTQNDSIIIYYDATLGDGGLQGYNGKVYAHTGVTVDGQRWRNVVGEWGNDNTQPELTRIDTDLYKLVIGDPAEFYGVPAGQTISELCFVFRSAGSDGPTGRDVNGDDLFYSLYETGVTAIILEPQVNTNYGHPDRAPEFLDAGESLDVIATAAGIGTEVDSIKLFVNETLINATINDTLFYSCSSDLFNEGKNSVYLEAVGSQGENDIETFTVIVDPQPIAAAKPAGIIEGVTQEGFTSATFCLFAPYKEFVYLIGDFNNWKVDDAYLMKRDSVDADSAYYWITLDNLSPGNEYAYQYLADGEARIADPYTEKVLDPWSDPYIPSDTYPYLKAYPDGKTDFRVSAFTLGENEYNWQVTNFQRSEAADLVVYELLVRDFIKKHDYETLTDTLDYLQNLGITAIELMPVNEFEGNESWGYNPNFYFAPDKYYGPKNDLKAFIDACHERGLAVIIDMVLNHSYASSPLVRLYNLGDYGKPTAENPWYNTDSPNPVYAWGYDFDHESPATKKFVDRVNRFWLTEYKVDGFRFDFTKGFTNKTGDGWAKDQSRINILKRIANRIWEVSPGAYVILEHFTDNSEEKELANHGMMIWGNMNHSYNEATMGYNSDGKSDLSWGFYSQRGWQKPHLVTYMESHDEERLMYKNLTYGNSSGDYNIKDLPTALNRMKLVGAFFFTLPGPKMIWQFGELGYDVAIDYNGRVGNKPIRWNYFSDTDRKKLYKTWAAMLKLRNENIAFRSDDAYVNLAVSGAGKRINITHDSLNVTIIGNFDVVSRGVNPNFQHAGDWYDYFSGDTADIVSIQDPITLEPGAFHIYTDKKLETPEPDLLTDIESIIGQIPQVFSLDQNYPNPFNPSTTIRYQVAGAGQVQLTIYNMLGEKVVTLVNKKQSPGAYQVKWQGTDQFGRRQASGVYFYRLQSGENTLVKKMIMIR